MIEKRCPCESEKLYEQCCGVFHKGVFPKNALELMRSRYSAYALGLSEYIMDTTHPASPSYVSNQKEWKKQIDDFCANTQFNGLEILKVQEGKVLSTIVFMAHILQNDKDLSFTEKSYFERIGDKWTYKVGKLMQGRAPNLMTTVQLKVLPLAYYGEPILRKVADRIEEIDEGIKTLVEEMIETMDVYDGIGLAAPQVHYSIRLFIIRTPIERSDGGWDFGEVKVFINPEIVQQSTQNWQMSEGCLSIPAIHSDVERPNKITVEYTNLEGKRIKEHPYGLEARIIMHENDHLNGTLFIDHLKKKERQNIDPLLEALRGRMHDGTEM